MTDETDNTEKAAVEGAAETAKEAVESTAETAKDAVESTAEIGKEKVEAKTEQAKEEVEKAGEDAISELRQVGDRIIDSLHEVGANIRDGIGDMVRGFENKLEELGSRFSGANSGDSDNKPPAGDTETTATETEKVEVVQPEKTDEKPKNSNWI